MKYYRYFNTERPIRTGTYPKKSECIITYYPQKSYVDGKGFFAWGHIDYDEPLTDAEVKEYELKPDIWEFNVRLHPNNDQMVKIHELLTKWRKCVMEDGTQPFKDYTVEKFFELMMQAGSYHTINYHIDTMNCHIENHENKAD